MKLSILIPTTPDREQFITRLKKQFEEQLGYPNYGFHLNENNNIKGDVYYNDEVEVLYFYDNKENSIGYKRNSLLRHSSSDYVSFIDSDDRIGPNYFVHAFKGIDLGVDACGLTGIITEDGQNPKKFVHSFLYDSWYEKDNVYYRNNNHLNVVKRSIAIQMKFPETNQGEDHSYSKQLQESGLIKTEHWDQDEIIYYYDYRSKK